MVNQFTPSSLSSLQDHEDRRAAAKPYLAIFAAFAAFSVSACGDESAPATPPPAPLSHLTPGDYNGDGRADYAIYYTARPQWYMLVSSLLQEPVVVPLGIPGDTKLVTGDFDGDFIADYAVTGVEEPYIHWMIRKDNLSPVVEINFGHRSGQAYPADYDGDKKTDLASFSLPRGQWEIRNSSDLSVRTVDWTVTGNTYPIPADYDGDGKTDLASLQKDTMVWTIQLSSTLEVITKTFGNYDDKPYPADYDGDGQVDLAVINPVTQVWTVTYSGSGATETIPSLGQPSYSYAVSADYDGDGKADFATYDENTVTWAVRRSRDHAVITQGITGGVFGMPSMMLLN